MLSPPETAHVAPPNTTRAPSARVFVAVDAPRLQARDPFSFPLIPFSRTEAAGARGRPACLLITSEPF